MPKATTYRQLLAEQAPAAVRISGAHHSVWNGRTELTDPAKPVDGEAEWHGTVRYNDQRILEPTREMFRNSRVHMQDAATLRSYRKAIKTMLHENVHMLAGEGSDPRRNQAEYNTPHGKAAEEGFTELYAIQKTDDYIDELGLEDIAPGIKAAGKHEIYAEYVQGADAFAQTIGSRSGLGSEEVVRRIATVGAAQKFEAAAAAIYDTSDLPGLVPDDQRSAAVQQIAEAMKKDYAQIDQAQNIKDPDLRRKAARAAGGAAARAGYDEIRNIRRQWSMPAPEARVERGANAEQTRSNDSPTNAPATLEATTAATPHSLPPGLATAVHASRSGAEPLTSATRLDEADMGSRRGGTQTAPERGPEVQR
ncbi:hypothetical protein HPO96_32285 [Kribbella sandramycini]|uniref:Uncharacterized protein n=1 Tax=Kribbella sandramycini TaxID=60450 RepID=A0A7Y4L871_9ACTN|nr:hypothetical protein [Kribbella sandramycini]MBB6565935.1 hypothetical protein [Kribbella sandramycini]NOL44941.1 hypothetical protein [Kribbella sandramycini]